MEVWRTGREGYGDVTDAVYRLVEDTWLDNWSAEKYVGTIFRDAQEAALVDVAVLRGAEDPAPGGRGRPRRRLPRSLGLAGGGERGPRGARTDGVGRRRGPGRAAAHA